MNNVYIKFSNQSNLKFRIAFTVFSRDWCIIFWQLETPWMTTQHLSSNLINKFHLFTRWTHSSCLGSPYIPRYVSPCPRTFYCRRLWRWLRWVWWAWCSSLDYWHWHMTRCDRQVRPSSSSPKVFLSLSWEGPRVYLPSSSSWPSLARPPPLVCPSCLPSFRPSLDQVLSNNFPSFLLFWVEQAVAQLTFLLSSLLGFKVY